MSHAVFSLTGGGLNVVGSFGSPGALVAAVPSFVRDACDVVEIRLDLVATNNTAAPACWNHLREIPLLFTARRGSEGGSGDLSAATRFSLLEAVLEEAACVDIEVASIPEMEELLQTLRKRGIPWIASFHHFGKLPDTALLADSARRAVDARATVFKAAAMLHSPADVARLAEFQLADHGIPVATMGMGPLAPVSRLLCAQCGSVLNYGCLGETPTAPGQWDAAFLKQSISRLAPFGS